MIVRLDEHRIAKFIDKYTPDMARDLRACRARMHEFVPRGFELVYDNYNALVFGFSATDRTSDAVLSIAGYPSWVTLFFLKGATIADAKGLLEGSGSRVRSIRLASPEDLSRADIRALIAAAMGVDKAAFARAAPLATIVKSVSARQRPRRPPERAVAAATKRAARRR